MVCDIGFEGDSKSKRCVRSEEYDQKCLERAKAIADYISSNIINNCTESRRNKQKIRMWYEKNYPRADIGLNSVLDVIHKYYSNIWIENDWYVTDRPIPTKKWQSLKCQFKAACQKHKSFVVATVIWAAAILGFIFGTIRKRRIRSAINAEVENILEALRLDRSNDFTYASHFQRVETHPLWKYWNEIISRIERNPSIVTLNSSNGRMWRCE